MSPRYTARWTASVSQDWEGEADTEEEARELLDEEMNPRRVVELTDFEVHDFEEVKEEEDA